MIGKLFYGVIFISLFGFFIYFGFLRRLIDFVIEFVKSFNSLGVFFQDPQIAMLAGIVGVIFAFAVVMAFKK